MNDNESSLDAGQVNNLPSAFQREGNWTKENIAALWEREGLLTDVLRIIEGRAEIVPISRDLLSVDYTSSFDDMIKAGKYNWVNANINSKCFPIRGEGRVEFKTKLFDFDHGISSEYVRKEIVASGWQVAGTEHLLAYGAKNPDEQRKYPIVALGAVGMTGDCYRRLLCLDGGVSIRRLYLGWTNAIWNHLYRFLAVRRST